MFYKVGVLKNFAKFTEELCRGLFLNKNRLWTRDSNTGVFLWILRNSKKHFFYRKPLGECFWFPLKYCPSCLQFLSEILWNKFYVSRKKKKLANKTNTKCFTDTHPYLIVGSLMNWEIQVLIHSISIELMDVRSIQYIFIALMLLFSFPVAFSDKVDDKFFRFQLKSEAYITAQKMKFSIKDFFSTCDNFI